MPRHTQSFANGRRGITLLEVLIAMFVLTVGILSVFGLFTAGRELEARATIKSDAIAYAGTLRNTIANEWIENWQDWLYVVNTGTFGRVVMSSTTSPRVSLPVLVDPCGLSSDTQPVTPFLRSPAATGWDWSRMTPLNSGTDAYQPFARLTLSATATGAVPLSRQGALAVVADQDAIEYRLPANDSDPPENAFELGRRKRGSDLVPALFVAATAPVRLSQTSIQAGAQVRRTLLIFHKAATDLEEANTAPSTTWPSGYLELSVASNQPSGLIEAQLTRSPKDAGMIGRSVRPGNWLLIVERKEYPSTEPGLYWFDTRWVKIKSATAAASAGSYLFVMDEDQETQAPASVYAFERLVHVVDDFEPINLP